MLLLISIVGASAFLIRFFFNQKFEYDYHKNNGSIPYGVYKDMEKRWNRMSPAQKDDLFRELEMELKRKS